MVLLEKKINEKKFVLVKNSIIQEPVEAIVNPANETLTHSGGVAGLISRSGGPEIQRQSNEKAPIKTGSAISTSAGKLPFKVIIHVAGPVWQEGQKNEDQLLHSAVESALNLANELNIETISMPAISTGIFGYPLKAAINIIVTTIFDYMKQDSSIKEIRMCENTQEKAEKIKDFIIRIMPTEKSENLFILE